MKTLEIRLPFGKKLTITVALDTEMKKSSSIADIIYPDSDDAEFYDWEDTDPFSY